MNQTQPHYQLLKHFGFVDFDLLGKPALKKDLPNMRSCWVKGNAIEVFKFEETAPVLRYETSFSGIEHLDDKAMICLLMALGIFIEDRNNATPLADLHVKEDGSITVLHIIEPVNP